MIRSRNFSKSRCNQLWTNFGCILSVFFFLSSASCHRPDPFRYTTVYRGHSIEGLSARALALTDDAVIFAGPKGVFGGRYFGGDLVEQPAVGGAEDFRDLHLFNNGTMILLSSGNDGKIFHIGFKGEQTKVYDSAGVFLDGMDFWDDQEGMAYGDPVDDHFFLLQTKDGGMTWFNPLPRTFPAILPAEAGFAASGTGMQCIGDSTVYFATGMADTARLFCSYDRGMTWIAKNTPLQSGGSYGIYSLYFWSEKEGMIAGGSWEETDYRKKICYYTSDGGNTWINRSKGLGGYTSCISGNETGSLLIATGDQGTYYSIDKGRHWELLFERNYYSAAVTGNYIVLIGREGTLEVLMYKI